MNPLELAFPGLISGNYKLTSPETARYNCIAWAAGDTDRWWWPDRMGSAFWPESIPREETISAFLAAFASIGYVPITTEEVGSGVETIAIFSRSEVPTHAARRLPSGRWTSKLGQAEDIEHDLTDLVGEVYGDETAFVARKAHDFGEK